MKGLALALSFALAIAGCTRTQSGPVPAETAPETPVAPSETPLPAAVSPSTDATVIHYPDRARTLAQGDGSENATTWQQLGAAFPELASSVLYGLSIVETPLLDADGLATPTVVAARTRLAVEDSGAWTYIGTGLRRLYGVRIESSDTTTPGWLDASDVVLIVAEQDRLAVGLVLRKIVVAGGESEYGLLALVDGDRITLVDTSAYPFPDAFHPSGVVSAEIRDVNGDGAAEVEAQCDTMVSVTSPGAAPLRWTVWLRPRNRAWVPVFRFNTEFSADDGYSYTAQVRAFDSSGRGTLDAVRVDTDYLLPGLDGELRARTTSFSTWNGDEYRTSAVQDLPKLGIVVAEGVRLTAEEAESSAEVKALAVGEELFVFDRSDARHGVGSASGWRYRAVTRSGVAGWVSAASVSLSWIDPMKVNREAFVNSTP
jgi:hypothetical protein